MTNFDPGQIMQDVDAGAGRLEKAAGQYHDAVEAFEKAEQAYELEMAKARMRADASLPGGKLPSQDRRHDMALTNLAEEQPEVYHDYFAAKASREALAVRYRALAAAVNARQSLLSALRGMGG